MDELLRLLDDARADEGARARARERALRQAAEEGATLAGHLLDLAEQGRPVRVRTAALRIHVGPVRMVGRDFVAVADALVRFDAIASIRPDVGEDSPVAAGDRAASDLHLLEALARLSEGRPRIALVTAGGGVVAGELRAVGADVVTIRLDGAEAGLAYVPGSSVLESNVNQIG
jgi:hypothetical protein